MKKFQIETYWHGTYPSLFCTLPIIYEYVTWYWKRYWWYVLQWVLFSAQSSW